MPGVKGEMREARVPAWLASSVQDLRHGVLLLRRDRAVSVPIVLVLALGIGGTAATFTLLQATFLEPLPYRDSGRLVTIMENTGWTPSVSEFLEIRARTRTLAQVAFAEYVDMQVTGNGEPARVFAARVSASFLSLLGAHAAIGRAHLEEENWPGRSPAVVLSHAFWQSKAGADSGIIGRTFRLDGRPATVVGVLPAGFQFDYPTLSIPEPVDMYVSYPIEPAAVNGEPKIVWSHNHLVSPDYFRTLRIPLLAGRGFRRGDAGREVNVAIVNREFARRFGLGADVIGKQFYGEPITIVGLVGNVRTRGLETNPEPEVYLSSLQLSWANVYLVVRSALPSADLLKRVKAAIGAANSKQPVFGVETMNDMIAEAVAEPRFEVFLIGAFALLAAAMAAAGMYSVISCLVSQRSGEVAIRLTLGASRGAIVRTMVGTTTAWVTMGLAGGMGLGLATRNTVRTLSSAVVVGSPWMYVAVALLFLAVTLGAASAPLWRSTRIDPAAALRCE